MKHKFLSVFLIAIFMILNIVSAAAFEIDDIRAITDDTAAFLLKTVTKPQVASTGGEWSVLGLARVGYDTPDSFYESYLSALTQELTENDGILHDKKYSEYSRVILALTAIGRNPANIAGYNLLEKLGDYEKTIWQGINGPIFALIALDSGGYEIPTCPEAQTQATRELYLNEILNRQLPDGGFSLNGQTADPDITGMALQALSNYQDQPKVKTVIDQALACLSVMQDETGGFESFGVSNLESTTQVIVALGELGISVDDSRFVKNGHSLVDNLLSYYRAGNGFLHTGDGAGETLMSTEQGLYALASILRTAEGKTTLYDMSDVEAKEMPDIPTGETGLPDKHLDVKKQPVTQPGKTFSDITGHPYQTAIEALASRGIISGISDTAFAPDDTMTRAQFATIITNSLGLLPVSSDIFSDVPGDSWYAPYVGTAFQYGIVKGTSNTTYSPEATITREEAAVMVARAAVLCGMDTSVNTNEIRDILAQFIDYTTCSEWAADSLAFCYRDNLLSQSDLEIRPKDAILRSEVASLLFQMLQASKLI